MNEHEIKRILSGGLAIPDVVERRFQYALNSIEASAATERGTRPVRRMARGLKRVLVIAAIVAALSAGTALAAYFSGEKSAFYQSVFGNTIHDSTEAMTEYDEEGKLALNAPRIERVPVDEEKAEELVGRYLAAGETYVLKSYTGVVTTVTIESLLFDYGTGAYFFTMSLERESGGFPEFGFSGVGDEVYFNGQGLCLGGAWAPGRTYYDRVNSSENKIYLSCVGVCWEPGTFDESEMTLDFCEWADVSKLVNPDDLAKAEEPYKGYAFFALEKVYLPESGSLPAVSAMRGDKTAVIFSAVGMRLYYDALGIEGSDPGSIKYVALEYQDGTRYVVRDDLGRIDNSNYACGFGPDAQAERAYLTYCFNRVADAAQVAKIIINDTEVAVG